MTVVNLLENILCDLRLSNFTKVVGIVTFNPANASQITRAHDAFTIGLLQSAKINFKKRRVRGVGYICLLGGDAGLKPPPITKPVSLFAL
jgi:hypothetical protein